jgi:hypothetical protein
MGREKMPKHIIKYCGYTMYLLFDNKWLSVLSIERIYVFHMNFRINRNYFSEIY